MFITPAFAQATGAGSTNDILMSLLPFVLIFVIMYFLILRPQQKRVKAQQEMITNLRRGSSSRKSARRANPPKRSNARIAAGHPACRLDRLRTKVRC